MDSIRSISMVSVAHFVVLGALSPAMADLSEEDSKHHHKHHGRSQHHAVSHSRSDYPVISNWLTTPEQFDPTSITEK